MGSDNGILDYVNAVSSHTFHKKEVVFREGDYAKGTMYFIFDGEVSLYRKQESGEQKHLTTLKSGEYFGEVALIKGCTRTASAIVTSDTARVANIDKEVFLKIATTQPNFLFELLRMTIDRMLAAENRQDCHVQ